MHTILSEIRLTTEQTQLAAIKQQFCAAAGLAGWQGTDLDRFELVLEEAVMNVVCHAYPSGSGELVIRLGSADGQELCLVLEDRGVPFDPFKVASPDINLPLDERTIGGLGVPLLHAMADGITYQRQDETNRLELTFRHRPTSQSV